MAVSRVKRKFPLAIALAFLAGSTAVLSWSGFIPVRWVESGYSRRIFPTVSHIAGYFADAVPFSWLDLWILSAVCALIWSLCHRNWRLPLGLASAGYLIFFWGWGLNYHRAPIEKRLGFENLPGPTELEKSQFGAGTTMAVDRLWPIADKQRINLENHKAIALKASDRVRRVIAHIDGTDWRAASHIKHSHLADWWFRAAGIDGVFNPLGHEPILAGGIPDFELPFLMAHELAHVYGIADEGDANFVAFLATVESDDPGFQYSALFEMWLHLGKYSLALGPGPKLDFQTFQARVLAHEIPQVTRLQSAILDSHLKANGVAEGVKSYSKFVALAIATRNRWADFR